VEASKGKEREGKAREGREGSKREGKGQRRKKDNLRLHISPSRRPLSLASCLRCATVRESRCDAMCASGVPSEIPSSRGSPVGAFADVRSVWCSIHHVLSSTPFFFLNLPVSIFPLHAEAANPPSLCCKGKGKGEEEKGKKSKKANKAWQRHSIPLVHLTPKPPPTSSHFLSMVRFTLAPTSHITNILLMA
jgi:hypothetical protein